MQYDMPDSKTVVHVLTGVARYADQEQFMEFCRNYLPADFFRRMRQPLTEMWLVTHGTPEDLE